MKNFLSAHRICLDEIYVKKKRERERENKREKKLFRLIFSVKPKTFVVLIPEITYFFHETIQISVTFATKKKKVKE